MNSEITNPLSSGGGGGFFEAKVQASFLLHLLIGGRVPCLPNGTVRSVRFQGKQAGYETDDIVLELMSDAGQSHRLLVQVKHHAAITKSDADFRAALQSAWADFNERDRFTHGRDVIALVTGPQSDRVIQHVRPLLDWARTSAMASEFIGKVATAGFSSDDKRHYLSVFRDVLKEISVNGVSDKQLWLFLRHFHLLSYDFAAQGSEKEATVLTVIDMARHPAGGLDAQAIWEALIAQAQEWNKTAGTYSVANLPERLKTALQPQRSPAQRNAVQRLREHSELVLDSINTELAPGVQLPRSEVVDELINAVEASRFVVVQGAAGSGKSAVVKMLVQSLAPAIVSFGFKAQEFNHPHIHQFLTSLGVGLSLEQLKCEFSLLPRKLLLVDGAEKLFELTTHEAFRQLIQQLTADPSWTVVLTSRESAAQDLREHLLGQWGSLAAVVPVPSLSSAELSWIAGRAPRLVPLLQNSRQLGLLRNLYILSLAWKAFPPNTPTQSIASIDERQFKDIVWREYVERGSHRSGGMPVKRRQCLLTVSVERARRMSLFVSPVGCDPEAVQALVDDAILVESKTGGYAPAHDVLEDWAVARFIGQEFDAKGYETVKFIEAVGTEPSMRRGFRLWLSEAMAGPVSQHVMDFVLSAFQRDNIPRVWRDEVAVSVLESENAGEFIGRAEQLLLKDGKALYRRLVHVLRTACKGPNESLLRLWGLDAFRSHAALGSVFVVPIGGGWAEFIQLTYRNLESFDLNDSSTVLGLLKDWVQGVGAEAALPPESMAAAKICLRYWGLLTAPYVYAGRLEEQFLELLLKIPQAAAADVEALIRAALANARTDDYHSRTLLEHVTKSIGCQPLCMHFPELVIEVAEKTWRRDTDDDGEFGYRLDLEGYFGVARSLNHQYFPPSALQGPFTFLLLKHPDLGLNFIVRLLNYAADCYAQSELGGEVDRVQLPTANGPRPVVGSARLWGLYRGLTTGPHVLECALMALEAWLLAEAKQGNEVGKLFQTILGSSTSVATIAVLGSIATAYPKAVGDKVLTILQIPEFYRWDFERSYAEHFHSTDLRSALGLPSGGIDELYYNERRQSADLPHRKSNLEQLAFRLQFTPLCEKVQGIIDQFLACLPPQDAQSQADKTWRIALHRMDARHFTLEPGPESGQVVLTPTEPAPDLQRFIDQSAERLAPQNRRLRLAWWGLARFRGEPDPHPAFPDWRDALAEAQALREEEPPSDATSLHLSGPVFVAAHLIRDHYSELNPTELAWCQTTVVEEVVRRDAETDPHDRYSRNSFDGSRPAAAVLPLLLQHSHGHETHRQIEECLAVAVTHRSQEVRDYAADGVRTWFWGVDAGLAKACVAGLLALAHTENRIRRSRRRAGAYSPDALQREVIAATSHIRSQILSRQTPILLKSPKVDLQTHDWPELLNALSMIPIDTVASDLKRLFAVTLSAVLSEAEAAEAWKSKHRAGVSYEFQYAFARLFARFVLARSPDEAVTLAEPLRDSIDKCPKCLGVLLRDLVYEEDRVRSGAAFWTVWRSVAGTVFEHRLLREGSRHIWRYAEMRELVRVLLFADVQWKKEAKEWPPITSNRDFTEWAASAVGNTQAGFGALIALLTTVGQVFLPDAILWLAKAVESAEGSDLLADPDADFQLEVLLRKFCYNFGTEVRQRPHLHRGVLGLLDRLVERGSHTGFRLRDYMLAPIPAGS